MGVFGEMLPDFSFPTAAAIGGGEGGTLELIFISFGGRGLVADDDDDDGGESVGGRGFGTDDDSGVGGRGLVTDGDDNDGNGIGGSGLGTDDDDDDDGVGGRGFVADDDDDDGGGGSGFVIADGDVLLPLDVDDVIDTFDDVIDVAFSFCSCLSSSIFSLFPGYFPGEIGLLSPRVTIPTFPIGLELVALCKTGTSIFVPSSSLVDMDLGRTLGFVDF